MGDSVICPTGQYLDAFTKQCIMCPEGELSCELSVAISKPTECEPGLMLLEGFENGLGVCEETGT